MFKHILFPTDGSDISERAGRHALDLARCTGARITVLHVIPPYIEPIPDVMGAYSSGLPPMEYEKAARSEAKKMLQVFSNQATAAAVACEAAVDVSPAPWEAIVRIANDRGCDAIVMASHGRGGLSALILGSETTKVLTHSKLPVLVTR
jgi:nucleotide-binding universal stress UspA family protein